MKKNLFSFLIAASVATGLMSSCNDSAKETTTTETSDTTSTKMAEEPKMTSEEKGVMVGGANMVPSKNIVENAVNSSDHTTLVAAVKAGGLAETLSGTGPFTVFAPTNGAFDKLPKGTVEGLLAADKKNDLVKILTYHVVPGAMMAADLKDGQKLTTVQGETLMVSVKDGKVMINGANVTIADIVSSNGVTHVIDAVVTPKK